MTNYTIQERFFVFLGLICLGIWFTVYYYHNKYDNDIQRSLRTTEEITTLHVKNSIQKGIAMSYWKSMYLSQVSYTESLNDEIDLLNNFWINENKKLTDELFDLKNKKSD